MISLNLVEDQLKKVGCHFRFWGRPEIRELAHIMMPGELIAQAVNGRYTGGFALLVATNHRLLLIDRKPMFLGIEDVRFDMITELDYRVSLVNAAFRLGTPNRNLRFITWKRGNLRKIFEHTQLATMKAREQQLLQQLQLEGDDRNTLAATQVGGLAMQSSGAKCI